VKKGMINLSIRPWPLYGRFEFFSKALK